MFASLDFERLDFALFILSLVANIGLGAIVWKYAPRNISRYIFSLFIVIQVLWISSSYTIAYSLNVLLWTRVVIFLASLHAFSFYLFIYTLHENRNVLKKKQVLIPLCFLLIVAGLNLTPLVIADAWRNLDDTLGFTWGPARPIFASFASLCVIGAFFTLFRKFRNAQGLVRLQWKFISIGIITTFSLILSFSFLSPLLFENANMVRFSHLYTLPFVFFAAYAILKHHFLNIRVLATELFAFLMVGISVVQLTFARSGTEFLFSLTLLVLLIFFAFFLIRNMGKEIKYQAQEHAYEDLKKLDQAKSEFISIASHQLRTPLSGIKGYISMMLEGVYEKDPEKKRQVLESVYRANERLITLANDLLNISRMQAGKIQVELTEVQLEEIIEKVIEEVQAKAEEKNLVLSFAKSQNPLPKLLLDSDKLHNVISNIVDNAIRYTKQGSVTVQIKRVGDKVQISVSDTGEGISKEETQTVFHSFKRGEAGQRLWTEGTGLGLYVAKEFVEMHGGKIWVESAGEGKGSVFYVELPNHQT